MEYKGRKSLYQFEMETFDHCLIIMQFWFSLLSRRNEAPQTGRLRHGSSSSHGAGGWKSEIKAPVGFASSEFGLEL